MYFATDRRSREIVPAHKANAWRDYFCPTCKAGVFLRDGKRRDKHFAHMPRQGKPECENFHPSNEFIHSWQNNTAVVAGPSVDLLRLSIELEPDHVSGRGPRSWRLCLTVPKSHDGRGKISIDLGGGDVRPITLAKLSLGAQTYTVDPTAAEFGAKWVSPEVHPEYKSAVEERATGLDYDAINVFSSSRQKLKPLANAFCWGESYYFVWRAKIPLAFPPGLVSHALAEHLGWSCALAVLPHAPDSELATWLTTNCNLPIIRSKREWAIVYPPPYAFDDNGSLEIPSTAEVVLALKSIGSQPAGELSCAAGLATVSVQLADATHHIAELTDPKGAGHKTVHFAWDGAHVVTLVTKPYPETSIEPAVALEFESDGIQVSAALHHARARHLFSRTRNAKARLTAIYVHPALHGELRHRRPDALDWTSEALTATTPNFSNLRQAPVSADLIERINLTLQNTSLDVELDFGAFGRFFSSGLGNNQIQVGTFRMQRELRARVEWLCKASGAFVTRQRQPIGILGDEALIQHFYQLAVPAGLLPHKCALETALRTPSANEATP